MSREEVDVTEMVCSVDTAQRLQGLRLMRQRIEAGIPSILFFSLARSLINDSNNDCRWQVQTILTNFPIDKREI
jgi:hypothetical protein